MVESEPIHYTKTRSAHIFIIQCTLYVHVDIAIQWQIYILVRVTRPADVKIGMFKQAHRLAGSHICKALKLLVIPEHEAIQFWCIHEILEP